MSTHVQAQVRVALPLRPSHGLVLLCTTTESECDAPQRQNKGRPACCTGCACRRNLPSGSCTRWGSSSTFRTSAHRGVHDRIPPWKASTTFWGAPFLSWRISSDPECKVDQDESTARILAVRSRQARALPKKTGTCQRLNLPSQRLTNPIGKHKTHEKRRLPETEPCASCERARSKGATRRGMEGHMAHTCSSCCDAQLEAAPHAHM